MFESKNCQNKPKSRLDLWSVPLEENGENDLYAKRNKETWPVK
jgi:hypothetical protein